MRRRRRFEQSRSRIRREFASNGDFNSRRTPVRPFRTPLCRELASDAAANSRQSAGRRAVAPVGAGSPSQTGAKPPRTPTGPGKNDHGGTHPSPSPAQWTLHTRDRRREFAEPYAHGVLPRDITAATPCSETRRPARGFEPRATCGPPGVPGTVDADRNRARLRQEVSNTRDNDHGHLSQDPRLGQPW